MRRGPISRQFRRERAETLAAERATRTDEQQIARLEAAGHGHCKEAKRLSIKKSAKTEQSDASSGVVTGTAAEPTEARKA